MKPINEDFVPVTLNEAIDYLYSLLETKDIEYIKAENQSGVHFTMGMYLRNNWSLWEQDTPLSKDIRNRFKLFCHGDDVSGLILTGLWAKVNGLNIDEELNKEADKYKKHWPKYGIDPETGEEILGFKPKHNTISFKLKDNGEIEYD